MTSTAADLLTLLGALIVVIGGTCGYWIWRDAREAAALRKREQEMADALQASVRQARIAADPSRPTNRYLSDTDGAPE